MLKLKGILCIFALICLTTGSIWAQEHAKELARARRAARLDAMRQLAETIHGIQITSRSTVKDFITENDQIKGKFDSFLKNVEEIGDAVYENNTCRITLAVTLDHIITELQQIYLQCPSRKFELEEFNNLRNYTNKRIFYATGMGVIKKDDDDEKPWKNRDFWDGVNSRGKMMALRAAQIDAYRNIAESVKGVRISSRTSVKDFVAENDVIRTAFNDLVRGATLVGTPRYKAEGIVEITIELHLDRVMEELMHICRNHYRGSRWNSDVLANISKYNSNKVIHAIGTGVPPAKYIRPKRYEAKISEYVPHWANSTIRAVGVGYPESDLSPKQAQMSAMRSAQMQGYEKLSEQIMSLSLESDITMGSFIMQNDFIQDTIGSFIKGAKIVDSKIFPNGSVKVEMELYLGHMWQIIAAVYRSRPDEER